MFEVKNTFTPCTDIFGRIQKYNFPLDQYAVFGSALMDVMGIRPAADLDIIVTPELFTKLEKGGWQKIQASGFEILRNGEADVTTVQTGPTDGDYHPDRVQLIKDAITINGCPFVRIEEVIKCRTAYNRDKDHRDIAAINSFLAKHPNI